MNILRDINLPNVFPLHRLASRIPPALIFWVCIAVLNALLFAPVYLFQRQEMAFFPWQAQDPLSWSNLTLQRANLDLFRLNLEFIFLVLLWYGFRPLRRTAFFFFIFAIYLLQLAYAVYEGFMRGFYLLAPDAYNDWPMIAKGTEFVTQSLHLSIFLYPGGLVLLLLVGWLLYALHKTLFSSSLADKLGRAHILALALILLAAGTASLKADVDLESPQAVLSSFTARLGGNITRSQATRMASQRFEFERLAPFYELTGSELAHKPNIYIIFIESYGSVLVKRDDFKAATDSLMPQLENLLEDDGWSVSSTLSKSPIWGGGSWIAYTSFLFGLGLESDYDFRQLLARYDQQQFPHLINYLKGQGYRSFSLDSSSSHLEEQRRKQLIRFFGMDEWLRFTDTPYEGPLYGWGPSMPDQYALNSALESIKARYGTPHVFFFITQNSHFPWNPLPELVTDWRSLNDIPAPEVESGTATHDEVRQRYLASIQYELNVLVDMIIKQGQEEDIFILIGDHQPARVARHEDGMDTPVHIISRDKDFTAAFEEYGFVDGLKINQTQASMHHAGFLSLIERIISQQYGVEGKSHPAYHPLGADLTVE